jgi:hypothetical protein
MSFCNCPIAYSDERGTDLFDSDFDKIQKENERGVAWVIVNIRMSRNAKSQYGAGISTEQEDLIKVANLYDALLGQDENPLKDLIGHRRVCFALISECNFVF